MTTRKREGTRVPSLNLASVSLPCARGAPGFVELGTTDDLSERGLKLSAREPLEKGDLYHVEFVLGGELVRAEARVVHVEEVRRFAMGLEFEEIAPEDRARLRRFLRERGFDASEA